MGFIIHGKSPYEPFKHVVMVQLIHGQMRPELLIFNCDMFVNPGQITCSTDTCSDNTGERGLTYRRSSKTTVDK